MPCEPCVHCTAWKLPTSTKGKPPFHPWAVREDDDSVGRPVEEKEWKDHHKIQVCDEGDGEGNGHAYVHFNAEDESYALIGHGYGFSYGFSDADFPPNATGISGIEVEYERRATMEDHIKTDWVKLTVDAGLNWVGIGKTDDLYWSLNVDETVCHGGPTDKWGLGNNYWTKALICQPGFGVMLKCEQYEENDDVYAKVDCIRVRVHYSV